MKYLYIVAAAGSGKRMGLGKPKQFLEYDGEPIFIKTLKTIENSKLVDEIIVVTGESFIGDVKDYCREFGITKLKSVVSGGNEEYIIAVQDGVRPFIKNEFIEKAYEELINNKDLDGVVTAVAVKDTVKVVDGNGFIVDTPPRNTLFLAQTPQVFRGKILKEAYETAHEEEFVGTDDSSLVERINGRVKLIDGSYDNIKITTVEDLIYLKSN